jgi:hypothetical protein
MNISNDDMMLIRQYERSVDILAIRCTLDTANRFRKAAGAPYIWWSQDDSSWLINVHAIDNAIRLCAKLGIAVVDNRETKDDTLPPYCGQCDPLTRHMPAIGGVVIRCPRCHPLARQQISGQPKEIPPEIDVYQRGIRQVREQLARLRSNGTTALPPVDDEDMPF